MILPRLFSMKNTILILLASLSILAITSCSTIKSTTYIEPSKSFVLGENAHSKYKATVKNTSIEPIEVYTINQNGEETLVATLNQNDQQLFKIGENVGVRFKNLSQTETAQIKIKANGESNLSMGYKNG